MKNCITLALAVTILSGAAYGSVEALGSIQYSDAGLLLGEYSDLEFSILYPRPYETVFDWSVLFSWDVTVADVGKNFYATRDTDECFEDFVELLTNGVADFLSLLNSGMGVGVPPGLPVATRYENEFIDGLEGSIDFQGYIIDRVGIAIDDLSLDLTEIGTPISQKYNTNYDYDITYTIYGEVVPEPATVFLLGFGCLALRRRIKA